MVTALKKQTKGDQEKVGLGIRRRSNMLAICKRVHWKNGCPNQKEKKKIPSVLLEGDMTGSGLYRILPAGDKDHSKDRAQIH